MSVNGIWTGEVYGPFGWETRGVFVFENGRILGGDHRQYTAGTYTLSGSDFEAELKVHYYGPPRTAFGATDEQFTSKISGKLGEDEIDGNISRPDKPPYELQIRLTKRMGLPSV